MKLDRIQAMQIFVRVAEAESFINAAETLSLPASTVTSTVKNLEKYRGGSA
jgi:LysR family transcriptional regulator, regulator for bpeEF and oprC